MEDLIKLAEKVVNSAIEKGVTLAVAESCTGGLISFAITSVNGSSTIFDRGFVTYSYESKTELLGVSKYTLAENGAVSEECVEEMATGAALNSRAHITVSVSGVAAPSLKNTEKPVGTIYFGMFDKAQNKLRNEMKNFTGDRNSIRVQAAKRAMELFMTMLNEH